MNNDIAVKLEPSRWKQKKYKMSFYYNGKKVRETHFGAKGYSDFTKHKDIKRKDRYLLRHMKNERWDLFYTPGSLSRWILWNKPTLHESLLDYIKRFDLTLVQ